MKRRLRSLGDQEYYCPVVEPYKLPEDVERHLSVVSESLFGMDLPASEKAGIVAFARGFPITATLLLAYQPSRDIPWQAVLEEWAVVSGASPGSIMSGCPDSGRKWRISDKVHPLLAGAIEKFVAACVAGRQKFGRPVLYPLVTGQYLAPVEPDWMTYNKRGPKDLKEVQVNREEDRPEPPPYYSASE